MTEHASTFERLSSGAAALDAILGGGIPAQSVTIVAGEPGSGKTVFTLQALFHHARQGTHQNTALARKVGKHFVFKSSRE